MEALLDQYGYLALMLGTYLEGETAILVASSLIHRGIFSYPVTVLAAFLGAFIGDWIYFAIGRVNGQYFLARRPSLNAKVQPVTDFFNRHQLLILFSYRFYYGLRVMIPLVIGMSGLRPLAFLFYSTATGLIWASSVSLTGYLIGRVLGLSVETFEHHLLYVVFGFASLGTLIGYSIKLVVSRQMNAEHHST